MYYMDPELKRELEEMRVMVKDNHRMLRAMRRAQWYGLVARIIIWIIVLALPLYLYQQYLQPIVNQFTVGTSTPSSSGPFGFPSREHIQQFIDSYRGE